MVFSLLPKRGPAQPVLTAASPAPSSKLRRRSEESGVDLAHAYRHGPPPRMLVGAFKQQVGWRLLDQESRLAVRDLLAGLVERVGGDAITFAYLPALDVDFPVEPEIVTAASERRSDLARMPELSSRLPLLEDELRDTKRRLATAEKRLQVLQGHYDGLSQQHDRMVNDHEAERTCSRVLANRLSADVQELASRLLQPQPVQVRHHHHHRHRSVHLLPPALTDEIQEIGPVGVIGEAGNAADSQPTERAS